MSEVINMNGAPIGTGPTPVKKEKPTKAKLIPYFWFAFASIMLGVISAGMSGIGAYQLIIPSLNEWQAITTASIFTLVVQVAILALVFALFRRVSKTLKTVIAVGLLVMWSLSILTAAGTWWHLLRSNEYAIEVNDYNLSTITGPLAALGGKMQSVSHSMTEVSQFAAKRAARENQFGDSCGASTPGKGSRWALRTRHGNEARKMAGRARAFNQDVQTVIKSAHQARKIDNGLLLDTYQKANLLLQNGTLSQVRNWAQTAASGYQTVFVGGRTNGKDLVCRDNSMARKLLGVVRAINEIPALPSTPPREKEVSMAESLLLSYGRLFAPLFASESEAPRGGSFKDYLPIFPAAVIEFMILLFAWIRSSLIKQAGIGTDRFTEFMNANGALSVKDFKKIEHFITGEGNNYSIFDLLERLTLPIHSEQYFVVPLGGDAELTRQAKRIIQLFHLDEGDGKNRFPAIGFDAQGLPQWFKEYNADFLDGVDTVHVYPVSDEVRVWRKNGTRDYFQKMVLGAA